MAKNALCRAGPVTISGKVTVTMPRLGLMSDDDLRIAALDPAMFAPCCDYARRFFPRTGLARAA